MSSTAVRMEEPWGYSRALAYAVILHAGLLALISMTAWEFPQDRPIRPVSLSIEAVIVDMNAIREQREAAQREADLAARREQQRIRREEQLAEQKAQQERERLAEIERQKQIQVEQARKQREELEQLREAQRERERLAALELQRQQAELDKIRQQRLEQEKAIEQQAKELRELAERRKAEEAAAEAQRRQDLIASEQLASNQSAENVSLQDQYIGTIKALVEQNWLRPPSARRGLRCNVHVQQIPGGEVISANIVGQCNGDEATRRSIIAAVMKVGYLPYNGFERVFDRDINFIFEYQDE